MATRDRILFLFLTWLISVPVQAQVIDFETLPDGSPTLDQQTVCDEYIALGVRFELVDRTTGEPIGCPRIAKFGPPENAFQGCFVPDTPRTGQSTGNTVLTDGTSIGLEGDLVLRYDPPVSFASGVIFDIDCRTNGGPPCEQWTITARDAAGQTLATRVIDGPPGAVNPECAYPPAGPGDSMGFGWSFDLPGQQIASILLRHTGEPTNVGLAFDDFSPSDPSGVPWPTIRGPREAVCSGHAVELLAETTGGAPPYTYQWQEETAPGVWTDLGTGSSQIVGPLVTTGYRVEVIDENTVSVTSDVFTVEIVSGPEQPACNARLLVSSNVSHSILRYNAVDMTFVDTFVAAGSAGLDRPTGLVFGRNGNLYVASQGNDSVLRYDGGTGAPIDVFVATGSGGLDAPTDLEFGPDGNLYVASSNNDRILRYDRTTGAFIDTFIPAGSGGLDRPVSLLFQVDGTLLVSSQNNSTVKLYDAVTGTYLSDCIPAGSGDLGNPRGLAYGPDGRLYVGQDGADNIKAYESSCGPPGGIFVLAGSGDLSRPTDSLFGRDDNLYVASYDNDRILRYGGQSGVFMDAFPTGNGLDGPAFLRFTLYCSDGVCDPAIGESSCSCEVDCGPPPAAESTCNDGVDDDCDLAIDCDDDDCAADLVCAGAGGSPDGAALPGTALMVWKNGNLVDLDWGDSCLASDVDYEIYEGLLGSPSSHVPVTCSTAGALSWTLTPAEGQRFYLVVPHNGAYEGSAGRRSDGEERPQGAFPCRPRLIAPCP